MWLFDRKPWSDLEEACIVDAGVLKSDLAVNGQGPGVTI